MATHSKLSLMSGEATIDYDPQKFVAEHATKTKAEHRMLRENGHRLRAHRAFGLGHLPSFATNTDKRKCIQSYRDKRNPIFHQLDEEEVEFQGFGAKAIGSVLSGFSLLLAKRLTSLAGKANDLAGTVSGYVKVMEDAVADIKRKVGSALWMIPLVMCVYLLSRRLPSTVARLLILALGTVLGIKAWSHFKNFFRSEDEITLQSGLLSLPFGKLLATVFAFSVFKGRARERNVTEFQKRITMFDRFADSWDSFSDWVATNLDRLVQFCSDRWGTKRVNWFKRERSALMKWCDAVDALCCRSIETARVKPSEIKEMIMLLREGNLYLEKFRGTNSYRYVVEYMTKITNYMVPFQGAINARNNFRFEPVSMVIHGEPGIGKTVMNMFLAMTVMKGSGLVPENCSKDDLLREIWQKGASEYWNGYAEQTTLAIDDAFQKRATGNETESDYLNFIKLVSSFSCPLNFADVNSKGKIYFLSSFILATTNLLCIKEQAEKVVIEPAAVTRRFNFALSMRVKPEFALPDGKLDYYKYKDELSKCAGASEFINRYPWYIWEARSHDFLGGQTDGEYFCFTNAVRGVINEISRRLEAHKQVEKDIDTFLGVPTLELQSGIEVTECNINTEDCDIDGDEFFESYEVSIEPCAEKPGFCKVFRGNCKKKLAKAIGFDVEECNYVVNFLRACAGYGLVRLIGWSAGKLAGFAIKMLLTAFGTILSIPKKIWSHKPRAERQSNRVEKPKVITKRGNLMQGFADPIPTNIRYNTYTLSVNTQEGYIHIGTLLFLTDNLAVFPTHFRKELLAYVGAGKIGKDSVMVLAHNEACSGILNSSGKRISDLSYTFPVSHFLDERYYELKDRELTFLTFTKVRSHTNITSYFLNAVDVKSVGGLAASISLFKPVSQTHLLRYSESLPSLSYKKTIVAEGKEVNHVFEYRCDTQHGDCGAPVTLTNAEHFGCRQAVGIHIAGNTKGRYGYCSIITQVDIEKAIQELNVIKDLSYEDWTKRGLTMQSGFDLPFEGGSMLPIAIVAQKPNITSKSKFYQTSLYGSWGDYDYAPAHMKPVYRDGQKIYPLVNAMKPFTTPVRIYDVAHLSQAVHVATGRFNALTKDFPKRLYTFEEAVLGVPNEKFRAIPRSTSSGYPMCLYTKSGKKDVFGTDLEYDLTTPLAVELKQRVEHILESAAKGERLGHLYMDFLKDELRSSAKNDQVATRLIACAPLDYTVAWRMMFGAYSAAMFRVNTDSGMCPGICTFSDWPKLANYLNTKGKACFDGDFKGFDSSQQPTLLLHILDAVNAWYNDGPINARIRQVLWLDLVHSRHITGLGNNQQYIVQWNKSLPSGHPFTTIVNSIYSLSLLVAAYIQITGDQYGYWSKVYTATYGDDNVSNVTDDIVPLFNQQQVSVVLGELFGVQYTSAAKDGFLYDVSTLDKMSFLKRGFYKENNRYLCPLELNSFLYTPYWCGNRRLEQDIIIDTMENALEELSLHEPGVWEAHAEPVIAELVARSSVECPLPRALPNRESYQKLVLSRVDNWY